MLFLCTHMKAKWTILIRWLCKVGTVKVGITHIGIGNFI